MVFSEVPATTAPVALSQVRQVVLQPGMASRLPSEGVGLTATNSPTASPKVDQVVITPDDEGTVPLFGNLCSFHWIHHYVVLKEVWLKLIPRLLRRYLLISFHQNAETCTKLHVPDTLF
jgi:hypothetical protein